MVFASFFFFFSSSLFFRNFFLFFFRARRLAPKVRAFEVTYIENQNINLDA